MPKSLAPTLNSFDLRIAALEQVNTRADRRVGETSIDPDTGVASVKDPLDWTVGGWESYTQPVITTDAGGVPTTTLSAPYEMAQTHRVGSWCVLTGMVRRKTGDLLANTRYRPGTASEQPIFALPDSWRPSTRTILPCSMGNANPLGAGAVTPALAWIEVAPRTDKDSGAVYYVSGTIDLTAGTGWVALTGMFPLLTVSYSAPPPDGSWGTIENWLTWNGIEDGITWDSYPNYATP